MTDICLNISFNIPSLDDYSKSEKALKVESSFHTHLIIEDAGAIVLKIFFNNKTNFDYKITDWLTEERSESAFGKSIVINNINERPNIEIISFANSFVKGWNISTNQYEGNNKFIIFKLGQIRIEYKPVKKYNFESEIYFTDSAYSLINENFNSDNFCLNPNIWESINYQKELVDIGKIKFIFDFFNQIGKDNNGYDNLIIRKPRLVIKHDNLSFEEISIYVELIVSLMELYTGNDIKIHFWRHHSELSTVVKTYDYSEKAVFNKFNFGIDFDGDLYTLITSISLKMLENTSVISEITHKYNLARISSGSINLVLLFSIIEKLKKHFGIKNQKGENFQFTDPKIHNKIDEFFDELLEEIEDESQKTSFLSLKKDKISMLVYLPLKDQFNDGFLEHDLDPVKYNLDFKRVIKMRNEIFHGKFIEPENQELKSINDALYNFVGALILKYLHS
jgi:hypothetical protein